MYQHVLSIINTPAQRFVIMQMLSQKSWLLGARWHAIHSQSLCVRFWAVFHDGAIPYFCHVGNFSELSEKCVCFLLFVHSSLLSAYSEGGGNNNLIDYCPCPHLLNEKSLPWVSSLHVVHFNMIMLRFSCTVCVEEALQASPDISKQARASC